MTTPTYDVTQGMHLKVTLADGRVVRDEMLPALGKMGTLNLDIPEGVPLAAEEPELDIIAGDATAAEQSRQSPNYANPAYGVFDKSALKGKEPEMDMRTSSYPINGDRIRHLEAERDGWHESYKKRGEQLDQMENELRHWKALVERHEQALGKFLVLAREVQS